ncbi:MAG: hypothetical protein ACT4PK_08330 [Gammaproteobacteria bacterium]
MFAQAAVVALRILLFRAGPQDFPHAPQLVAPLPAIYASAYFAVLIIVLPPGAAALLSLANLAALAFATHSVLSARQLANRFQQTFHALLATGAVLTLASVPPMVQLAPVLQQMAANPELLRQPDAVQVPAAASLLLNLLNLWNFAVYAHIFRHAAETRLAIGVLIALFVVFSVLLFLILASQLLLPLVM